VAGLELGMGLEEAGVGIGLELGFNGLASISEDIGRLPRRIYGYGRYVQTKH
jgi:hypothetical protein